jgi:hypothetical protein
MSARFILWLIAVAARSKAPAVLNQFGWGTFADDISSSGRMVTKKYE